MINGLNNESKKLKGQVEGDSANQIAHQAIKAIQKWSWKNNQWNFMSPAKWLEWLYMNNSWPLSPNRGIDANRIH